MSKSGFTTLNRWLGRKNKDKSMVNGKLSKSSTNLSISSTNINETSQLEYNRITPLPAATTNAPFEQTFRITVLLPKDQLYVTRLGARVPLSKLLELVCDNKLLDKEKYEFRNPVDASQVYSCDLTIGAVGLSEIRLCHKTESYDNFNSDEIIKLHRTSLIRESLSSSEFSSRNSKHTTKTTSPYSSTNSLNSMDSSAVSCGRAAKLPLTTQPKVSAPPRKKRAAPRPPSQIAIPEKSPLIMENERMEGQYKATTESPLATKKDFSISTPNLSSSTMLHSDINGNDCNGTLEDFNNDLSSGNGSLNSHGYSEDTVLYAQIQKKNALNLNNQSSKSDLEESGREINSKFPEPSPRKKIVLVKKKTAAPPAPPPRNSVYQEDAVSIASTNLSSSNSTPSTPKELNNPTRHDSDSQQQDNEENQILNDNKPTPVPRITTSTTLLNATDIEHDLKQITNECAEGSKAKQNISKVTLNRTPTPEPRSLSCEPPEIEPSYETQIEEFKPHKTEEDCISKQADSGIGEPVPSPLPDSLPSEVSNLDVKSQFESSSDDDDMVKVYNFKLGKTLVKPVSETKTLEELTVLMNSGQEETDSEMSTPLILTQVSTTPNTLTETSSWNFAIPISPPPNFADSKFIVNTPTEPQPDTPITPKITERPVLDFEILEQEEEQQEMKEVKEIQEEKSSQSPSTPLDSILHELNSIIQDKGVDSLMKKCVDPQEIEAAKPNTLSNFSINVLTHSTNNTKPKEVLTEKPSSEETKLTVTVFAKASSPLSSPSSSHEEEKLYRKRCSVSSLKQRRSVTRSDSFHSTVAPNECIGLNKRTFSQLSLDQMAGNLNGRRSSSELSIAESPSLQSLEIIKTILNSRKNSLANSSGEYDQKEIEVNARRPSEELMFASLELKTSRILEKSEEMEKLPQNDVQNKEETKNVEVKEEKSKELPKIYRYSGPPSINFSTWNERPKSQVAIKNEGDYIFGGAKSNTFNKNYRQSTPAFANQPPPVAPKPAAIERMGIPAKEYKVPILVKPLQDVIIDKVPATPKEIFTKSEISNLKPQTNGEIKSVESNHCIMQRPTVESVLRPQTQVIVNTSCNTLARNSARPTIESVLRPQSETIVNTSTLPRANKQRFSTPADAAEAGAVASGGPQILRSASSKRQQEREQNYDKYTSVPGPQILRSSSTKRQENEKSSTPPPPQAPFGQNTLRRTGFKEKIMAKEEQETQKDRNMLHTMSNTPTTNGDLVKISTNQKFNNSLTSAKLHLNLKKINTSVTTITTSHPDCRTASPSFTTSFPTNSLITETSAYKLKSLTPKTPPSPPAMMIQLKPVTQVRTTPITEDPRDELLSAIRNFKKEGLKKA